MLSIYPQSALSEFYFCDDCAIYKGIFLSGTFYKLIAEYPSSDRIEALALACLFEQQGSVCVVSAENDGTRKVWVDIRADSLPLPLLRLKA